MKGFFKIGVTQASFKEAGTANSAMDLLIMSAMIGVIVPGSFSIIHVGTGSKPHVLLGDFPIIFIMSLVWTGKWCYGVDSLTWLTVSSQCSASVKFYTNLRNVVLKE